MLAHHLQPWTNIKPTFFQIVVFAVSSQCFDMAQLLRVNMVLMYTYSAFLTGMPTIFTSCHIALL